jgi:hypothetical protein
LKATTKATARRSRVVAVFILMELSMTQLDLNRAVARATGESEAVVDELGFHLADPLDVNYDPEARGPLVLDWDNMCVAEWSQV